MIFQSKQMGGSGFFPRPFHIKITKTFSHFQLLISNPTLPSPQIASPMLAIIFTCWVPCVSHHSWCDTGCESVTYLLFASLNIWLWDLLNRSRGKSIYLTHNFRFHVMMAALTTTQTGALTIILSSVTMRLLLLILKSVVRYPSSICDGPPRKQWMYCNITISLVHSFITAVFSVYR